MKKSKQFLKSVYNLVAENDPCPATPILQHFRLKAYQRKWAMENLSECVEVFTDPETHQKLAQVKADFTCPNRVKHHGWFINAARLALDRRPGRLARELYQLRGFNQLLVESLIEDGFIIRVKDPHAPTPEQHRLFWAETHGTLAKGTKVEVDEETTRARKHATQVNQAKRNAKYVTDIERFVKRYCRKHFPFFIEYYWDEMEGVIGLCKMMFPGPRVPVKLFSQVLNRKLYHEARTFGWRRVRDTNRWEHEILNEFDFDRV